MDILVRNTEKVESWRQCLCFFYSYDISQSKENDRVPEASFFLSDELVRFRAQSNTQN